MCLNGRNLFFSVEFFVHLFILFCISFKRCQTKQKIPCSRMFDANKNQIQTKKRHTKKKSKGTHNYGRCQNNLRIYFNTVTFVKMSVCHTDYHLWRHLFTLGRSSQRKSQQLSKCTQNDFSSSFFTRTSHCNGGAWVLLFSEYWL